MGEGAAEDRALLHLQAIGALVTGVPVSEQSSGACLECDLPGGNGTVGIGLGLFEGMCAVRCAVQREHETSAWPLSFMSVHG